jgi:hypothetical protein
VGVEIIGSNQLMVECGLYNVGVEIIGSNQHMVECGSYNVGVKIIGSNQHIAECGSYNVGVEIIGSNQHIKQATNQPTQELRDVELRGACVHVPLCIQPSQRSERADGFVIGRPYN